MPHIRESIYTDGRGNILRIEVDVPSSLIRQAPAEAVSEQPAPAPAPSPPQPSDQAGAYCEDLKRVVTEAPSKFASILGPESNAVWIARIQLPGWDEGKTTRYFSCQLPPFTTLETIRAKRDEAAAYVKPCLGPDWTERRAQFSDQSTDITNFKGQDDPVVRLRESYYKDSKDWILRIDIDAPASLATPAPAETPADQPLTTPSPPETAPEAPNQPMIAPPSTY